jgi:uncharacterized protein with FMN-binding domain
MAGMEATPNPDPTPEAAEHRVRPRPVRAAPAKRRHAARKTRVAAVGLSVVATTAITNLFARADRAEAATVSSASKTFTGAAYTNKWGTTQVKITVKSGKITDVATVTLPAHTGKSVRLSNHAASALRTEVLTAQTATVDTVSGATQTSDSYLQSLQSAIDKARAAGALV